MYSLKMWSLVIVGTVAAAACGDSKSSMNPVAPSAVVVGAQSDEADAGDGVSTATGKPANPGNGNGNGKPENPGNGNGGDNGNGNGKQPTTTPTPGNTSPGNTTPAAPTTRKVEIEGLISAKAGDSITVNGQTVVVPSSCTIRHGSTRFTFSELGVGDRVHVRAMRTTTGAGATASTTLEATEVMLQNPSGSGGDDDPVDPTALVSVSAFDALAAETGSNTGAFRLTRSGSATMLASPLTVTFALSGTATNGADYTNLPLTATFLANQSTVDVLVTPLVDSTTEGSESVVLTLMTVDPYDLGSPATATVTITDTDSPLVSVTAFDSTASETGPDLGTFRFSRTGSTTASLTVTFTVTGTATNGTDYQSVPLTVTFGAGSATADLFIVPLPDGAAEGSETAIVTVTDGATYDLSSPSTATVTIAG